MSFMLLNLSCACRIDRFSGLLSPKCRGKGHDLKHVPITLLSFASLLRIFPPLGGSMMVNPEQKPKNPSASLVEGRSVKLGASNKQGKPLLVGDHY